MKEPESSDKSRMPNPYLECLKQLSLRMGWESSQKVYMQDI